MELDLKVVLDNAGGSDAGLDDVLVVGHVLICQDFFAAVEEVLGALYELELVATLVRGLQGLALPQPRDPARVLWMQVLGQGDANTQSISFTMYREVHHQFHTLPLTRLLHWCPNEIFHKFPCQFQFRSLLAALP